jgi:hypothetical protein
VKRLHRLAVLSVGFTTQCDFGAMVVVTAPLTHPLPSVCIKSALDTITRSPRTRVAVDSAPPKEGRGTIFWLGGGTPYEAVEQYEYRDGTASLETSVSRFPAGGVTKSEAESLGKDMGTTLLRVRDACGGFGLTGSQPYKVKRKI